MLSKEPKLSMSHGGNANMWTVCFAPWRILKEEKDYPSNLQQAGTYIQEQPKSKSQYQNPK